MENKENKDTAKAGCGCGCGTSKTQGQPEKASCCDNPAKDDKNINLNAACCGPSSAWPSRAWY